MNAIVPKKQIVSGAKGGGKGSGGNSSYGGEQSNTIRSRAVARFVELLSEGEIVGLVDGSRSIFFDDTPLQNVDGSYNFNGVDYEMRVGLPDQEHLNGFTTAETYVPVDVRVKQADPPPVRTITNVDADAVRVVVKIPALYVTNTKSGDMYPMNVSYAIEVKANGGGWERPITEDIIQQKTISPYQRSHRVVLPLGGAPWDIRVVRLTPDAPTTNIVCDTYWDSYAILVEGKFVYPNSAVIAMSVNAQQFGTNIPARSYDIKGLKIKIPTNYDPDNRSYAGMWDGGFKIGWTNNPAWILYDLLTNNRYGLGEFIDAGKVDKWNLYQIAQYCDQGVPSGYKDGGGADVYEPRYTFNGVINAREEAYRVLQQICSAFRGMAYWSLGQVYAVADFPRDPVKLVTPANVIGGAFNYTGTAIKARHSAALVTWSDPLDQYRPAVELVQNDEMLQRFGWRQIDVTAPGCTSRGQAHRYGRWVLDTEQHETETIEYEASWDHVDVKPGDIIAVADPRKAQVRAGGRIQQVDDRQWIWLDAPFAPASGHTYQLIAVLPDGTVQSRPITVFSEGNRHVTIASPFDQDPLPGSMWVITGTDIVPRKYGVLSVVETDTHTFRVTALFHDPTKYARVEDGIMLDPPPYTRPRDSIKPPTNLAATETKFYMSGTPRTKIILSWTPPDDFMAKGYAVSAQTPLGFESYGETPISSIDILDNVAGHYTFNVVSVSKGGQFSEPAVLEFDATGWEEFEEAWVSHLEIFGRGSSPIFSGREVKFVWRNNFPGTTYDIGSEPNGAGDGQINPYFRDNVVRIFDADDNTLLRTEYVTEQMFTYTYLMNVEDNGKIARGPQRRFRIEVVVRDQQGRESSRPAKLVAENPPPEVIIPRVWAGIGSVYVDYNIPTDLDFAGALIWMSDNPDFDPLLTTPVYDGQNNFVNFPAEQFKFYYVRIAGYDAFGRDGLNISPAIEVNTTGVVVDNEPPPIPTGLILTQSFEKLPTGETQFKLHANWNESPAENFYQYDIEVREGTDPDASWIGYTTNLNRYDWVGVLPGTLYTVKVKANSKNGISSGYSVQESLLIVNASTPPGMPTSLFGASSLKSVFLRWTNPTNVDFRDIEIWWAQSNNRGVATRIGVTKSNAFTHSGLGTLTSNYYWVRAVNTSGIVGEFNAGPTSGTVIITGLVASGDIAANSIYADHIVAGEISGDKLDIFTSLPATITIGSTGVSIGGLTDPAARINAHTTQIQPGKILISGSTTLASWRDGTDLTKIAGGSIKANSIDANILTVGLRGLTFAGLQFSFNKTTNVLSWSSGTVSYINDVGASTTDNVNAGSVTRTTGTMYVAWRRGFTTLQTSTNPSTLSGADYVILCTYRGNTDMVATYGRTIIDGSQIVTQSLTADLVSAGEFITSNAQIRGGIIENVHLAGNVTFDKLAGGTLSVATLIRVGGDRFVIRAAQQVLEVRDAQALVESGQVGGSVAGRTRVRLGRLGSGTTDYGIQIYDSSGTLIFGSGGFGTSAIPVSALNGAGPFLTLAQINAGNIGTYIAGAAISEAYIGVAAIKSLHVGYAEIQNAKILKGAVSQAAASRSGGKSTSVWMGLRWDSQVSIIATHDGSTGTAWSVGSLFPGHLRILVNGGEIAAITTNYTATSGIANVLQTTCQTVWTAPGDGTYEITAESTINQPVNGITLQVIELSR